MEHPDTVQSLWEAYLQSIGENPATTPRTYTSWCFCDNEQDANELVHLVKIGQKKATASSPWTYEPDEPLPLVGEYSIITDWSGAAQCIIQLTGVEIIPFNEVREEFARLEGEGDLSLAYWRKAHWDAFSRELIALGKTPSETMPVACQTFEVVYQPDSAQP